MDQKIIKERLIKLIFNNLSSIPNVLSVTLVGSFIDRKDLIGISDIDTIVVCDSLNQDIYNECVKKIGRF